MRQPFQHLEGCAFAKGQWVRVPLLIAGRTILSLSLTCQYTHVMRGLPFSHAFESTNENVLAQSSYCTKRCTNIMKGGDSI